MSPTESPPPVRPRPAGRAALNYAGPRTGGRSAATMLADAAAGVGTAAVGLVVLLVGLALSVLIDSWTPMWWSWREGEDIYSRGSALIAEGWDRLRHGRRH